MCSCIVSILQPALTPVQAFGEDAFKHAARSPFATAGGTQNIWNLAVVEGGSGS